jgi:diaminopimelate epimerase
MELAFEKWHGCQNDFILLWLKDTQIVSLLPSFQRQAPGLCSRAGDGIGADTILLCSETKTGVDLWVINRDGSLAKNCGNGLRCAALSARLRQKEPSQALAIRIQDRSFWCSFEGDLVLVYMDHASIQPQPSHWNPIFQGFSQALTQDWSLVDMGNPHLVFFLDDKPSFDPGKLGADLQKTIEDGINVHVVYPPEIGQELSKQETRALAQTLKGKSTEIWDVFVYERGVGPTKACASGAGAIGLALLAKGLISRREWITLRMPGGSLFVQQTEPGGAVGVAGPGEMVFRGILNL